MVASEVVQETSNILDELIESHDFAALRELTRNWRAGDLADVMEPLSAEKEAIVFRLLPRRTGRGGLHIPARGTAESIAACHGAQASCQHVERHVSGRPHLPAGRTAG